MVRVGGYSHNEVLGPERAARGINSDYWYLAKQAYLAAWQKKKILTDRSELNNSGQVSPPDFVWVMK